MLRKFPVWRNLIRCLNMLSTLPSHTKHRDIFLSMLLTISLNTDSKCRDDHLSDNTSFVLGAFFQSLIWIRTPCSSDAASIYRRDFSQDVQCVYYCILFSIWPKAVIIYSSWFKCTPVLGCTSADNESTVQSLIFIGKHILALNWASPTSKYASGTNAFNKDSQTRTCRVAILFHRGWSIRSARTFEESVRKRVKNGRTEFQ